MDAPTQLRVVSLLPGVTETICILGFQDVLVGRSHNCKWPSSVLSVPCVSCPAGDALQTPLDFDDRMMAVKELSPYRVDIELLKELRPEVIFTKDEWQACGVSFKDLKRATAELIWKDGTKCRTISFKPRTVDEVFNDIQMVANVFCLKEKGEHLVGELKTRWKRVKEATPQWADGVPLISVACFQSLEPLMGTGYWIPEIISCAGGLNVFSQLGYPGPVLAWEDVSRANPDVIVVILKGFTMEDAAKKIFWLESKNDWSQLRSVIARRVFLVNGDRFLTIPGPNIVESAELIAELLHGIDFGYEGTGFIRWKGSASPCRFCGEGSKFAPRGPLLVGESSMQDTNVSVDCSTTEMVCPEHCNCEHSGALQLSPNNWLLSETSSIVSIETYCTDPMQSDDQWNMQIDTSVSKQGYLSDVVGKNENSIDSQFMSSSQIKLSGTEVPHQSSCCTPPDINYSKNQAELQGTTFSRNKIALDGFDTCLDYLDEDDGTEFLAKRWKQTLRLDSLENPSNVFENNSSKKTPAISTHEECYFNSKKPDSVPYRDTCLSDSKYAMLTTRCSWKSERELFTKMWRSTKAAAKFRSSNAHVSSFRTNATLQKMGKPPVRGRALSEVFDKSTSLLPHTSLESSFGHQFEGLNQHLARSCTTMNFRSAFPGLMLLSERSWTLRRLICMALRDTLPADCLLLSGGLNSGILAEVAPLVLKGGFKAAITVLYGPTATDTVYAGAVAKRCSMDHIIVGGMRSNAVELVEQELDFVIKVMRTFDPLEVRRCVALAAALRKAKNKGFQSVVSGDGADELFAGHPFMQEMTEYELKNYRQSLGSALQSAAVPLGESLGIEVRLPYMHPKVIQYALGLDSADLLGPEKGSLVQGKWVLREAFHDVLSAWRNKDAIEVGTGMTFLAQYFSNHVSATYLEEEKKRISFEDKVQIRDAEHLKYYQAFKRLFKNDTLQQMERWGQNPCWACGYELKSPTQMLCLTCGQYPAQSKRSQKQECSMNEDIESWSKHCSFGDNSGSHNVVSMNSHLNQTEHDGRSLYLIDAKVHQPHHSTMRPPVPPPLSECEGMGHLFCERLPKASSLVLLERQQELASFGTALLSSSDINKEGLTASFARLSMCNDTGNFGGDVKSLYQEDENKSENTGDKCVAKENQITCNFSKSNIQTSCSLVPDEKVTNVGRKRKAEHIAKNKFWWSLGAGSAAFFLWSHLSKRLFLLGLEKFGKGDWRSISRNFVITRTPTQVASHAQKYFIRLNSLNKERRRSSIHDITSVSSGDTSTLPGPITGQVILPTGAVGKPAKHPSSPGLPSVSVYGTPVGQPITGPVVSAVGTPVMLPAGHVPYAARGPLPGPVVPGAPVNVVPVVCMQGIWNSSERPQNGPERSRTAANVSRMARNGPERPRIAQNGSGTVQNGAGMAPKRHQQNGTAPAIPEQHQQQWSDIDSSGTALPDNGTAP